MEVGGAKTMYLFPDMLTDGKSYLGEMTGIKDQLSKAGKPLQFAIFVTTLDDGFPTEYLISVWNIVSDVKFDPTKPQKFEISKRGKRVFFKPVA